MTDDKIYLMVPSAEDDRPVIEFDAPVNQQIDWQQVDQVFQGERSPDDYQSPHVTVAGPDATSWDCYSVPGTLGLFSTRAVEAIGHAALYLYTLFPATLNEARYHFLKPNTVLPVLDRTRSDVITFRSDPGRVKDITRYAFHTDRLSGPLVFSIPELPGLFVTASVYQLLLRYNIRGINLIPVA